jgi:hypothetical protein
LPRFRVCRTAADAVSVRKAARRENERDGEELLSGVVETLAEDFVGALL